MKLVKDYWWAFAASAVVLTYNKVNKGHWLP